MIQKKEKVAYNFICKGDIAFIQLERYIPLTRIGKTVLPIRIKNDLQALGWPVSRVIFCRFEDIGATEDNFFKSEVEVPRSWMRYTVKAV